MLFINSNLRVNSYKIKSAFPPMPSYNRFLELQQKTLVPVSVLAKLYGKAACDGVSFIDSFSLKVCHPKRFYSHKVFRGLATRGKTSVGWFLGSSCRSLLLAKEEVIDFSLTPANLADNNSDLLEKLVKNIRGKVYGDKGLICNGELFEKLYSKGIHVVTKIRKNMGNILMDISDKLLLKKRGIIASNRSLREITCNIEHSRYRNSITLLNNICSGLMAYAFGENKPSIKRINFILP